MQNVFAAAAAGVLALFGGMGAHPDRPTSTRDFNGGSTTHREVRDERPFGQNASSTKNVDFACVSAAVAARESSLDAAMTSFGASVNAAYGARATALATAYASSDAATVKSSVKTAWTNFKGAMTAAKKGWQNSKDAAWSTFKSAVKSCGGAAQSVSDIGNQGSEVSGQ